MPLLYRFFITLTISLSCLAITSSASARSLPGSFADLVEELSPAVVNISTTQKVSTDKREGKQFYQFQVPPGSPLEQFKELFDQLDPEGRREDQSEEEFSENDTDEEEYTEEAQSLGSGFVISHNGYVVTNNHVIAGAEEITVTFSDDTKAVAKIIGADKKTDLALLKVEVDNTLPYVTFGDSDKARVGDWVIAIGNPFGLGGSVSAGIISARARDINAGPFDDFIQTDAAINKGNSGGPLFDMDGNIIGINTAIYSPSGGNVGIGFAMPSALAEPVIEQLKKHGRTFRGWLGVKIQTVTEDIAYGLELKKEQGALIAAVSPGSPAEKGGLKSGDVILSFDGKDVSTMRKLPRHVADTEIGKKVKVIVWRDNKKKRLYVTVGEFKEEPKASDKKKKTKDNDKVSSKQYLGLKLATLNDYLRDSLSVTNVKEGVVVLNVNRKSDAAFKGIKRGDVITSVNQKTITSLKDLEKIITHVKSKKRKSILLLVNRNGESIFIALKMK